MAAVIFDLDGTLIDSAPDLQAALNMAFANEGVAPFSLVEVISFIGNGISVLVSRAITARALAETDHPRLLAAMSEVYAASEHSQSRLYPGVLAALDQLQSAGHRLGLCTNKPEAAARAVLEQFALTPYFTAVVGGGRLPVLKPDPAPLRLCMQEMAAEDVIFVGDSEVDAGTAAAAQQTFFLFTGGYRKGPAENMPQSASFDTFSQLFWLVEEFA